MRFRILAPMLIVALLGVFLLPTAAQPVVAQGSAQEGSLLAKIKERGRLICGINGSLAGFGRLDPDGKVSGFDADFCRVISAAIFGDDTKVEYLAVSAADRFPKLQAGEIDVLIRNTTFTLDRDTQQGAEFGPIIFYDGQSFMVRKADNLSKVEDLDGATVCVIKGTTTEQNLADISAQAGIQINAVPYDGIEQVIESFTAKRCDAVTSDRSQLASQLATAASGSEWTLFAENFTKEPLAPVIKAGDQLWDDVVRWVIYGTIIAEEYGIDSTNVDAKLADPKLPAEAKRLLGVEGELHSFLGLDKNWAVNVIKLVGNYGEIYERNLGALGIVRGANELWTKGGLLYAPPYR